eukprot:Gb_30107 [translate_table: standard]
MAGLYDKQAKDYAEGRPTYPSSLFSMLSSLTPNHHTAWDVGTGNGQAAVALADYYERVIATDVSEQQLQWAERRPNVTYTVTPTVLTDDALHSVVGGEGSVDLVTVATAVHWFDLRVFYAQVKRVLRKPGGVIAVWTYTGSSPHVNPAVDELYDRFMRSGEPYRDPRVQYAFDEYRTLPFPFSPVLKDGGCEGNPAKLSIQKEMGMEAFLALMRSSSMVAIARENGVDLFNEDLSKRFEEAWGGADVRQIVTFNLFLLAGTVRAED